VRAEPNQVHGGEHLGARSFHLAADAGCFADAARQFLRKRGLSSVEALGQTAILSERRLALFCSVRCPGEIIVLAYDLALALRSADATVVGGFHSPMEKECLTVLLRGKQPVIVCTARSVETMRIPSGWREPLASGRLLVLSPFAKGERRVTAELAEERNEFVAALADEVLVAYAEPGGKLEELGRVILARGQPLLVLDSPANSHLIEMGARAVTPATFLQR